MNGPERIVVRGVNWLGDAVMTTPALQRLREARPAAEITLVTPEKLADLWTGHRSIDHVLPIPAGCSPWRVGRLLRPGRYALGIVLPNSPRAALEFWFGGVQERVGRSRGWRNILLTQPVPPDGLEVPMLKRSEIEVRDRVARNAPPGNPYSPRSHQTHHYLRLMAAVGASSELLAPRLDVADSEMAAVKEKFGMAPSMTWCGLNAGAEYGPAKRWPAERFVAAAAAVSARKRCSWVVFGGGADVELADRISAEVTRLTGGPVVNVAGRTRLRELCALVRACEVLLTNDTGPAHVAAAVGTPVVVLFGSTAPGLTVPGLPGDSRNRIIQNPVPCAPCFRRTCPIDLRCLTGITAETVADAVLSVLD